MNRYVSIVSTLLMMRKFKRNRDIIEKVYKLKHGEEKEKPSPQTPSSLLNVVSEKPLKT